MSSAVDAPAGEVPVRDAATVVLLRDGERGLETWLLTRVRQLQFAAGMSVFPGGAVAAGDAELPTTGAVPESSARLADDPEVVRALLGAAVRETFEETGVLLTAPPAELPEVVADVEAGRVAFGDVLRDNGLSLDAAALRPWSRWVTPRGEVRRYDTRFFVAGLPADATARDLTSESSRAEWVPVAEALEQGQRGERHLLPPTALTLVSLLESATVDEVLAAAAGRSLEPVRPTLETGADGSVTVVLPDERRILIRPGQS